MKGKRRMTAETPALVRTFRVGKRTVTITAPQMRAGKVSCAVVEWSPSMPTRLSRREMAQYRRGRDAAFADLCRDLGVRGMLCEI